MSSFFHDKSDTKGSHERLTWAARRSQASSDSSSTETENIPSQSSSPSPPPRRSSWGFSQRHSPRKQKSPPRSSRPPLRRKLKWPSLRSQADPAQILDPQVFASKSLEPVIMSSPAGPTTTTGGGGGGTSLSNPDRDRTTATAKHGLPMPGLSGSANGPVGNLLKGPVDETGKLKDAALLVGIKLDLEAEVHATARVRGDIVVGLY